MANKHMERHSTSLVIRELQLKTLHLHFYLKKWTITSVDEDVETLDHSYAADGECKNSDTLEDNLAVPPKNLDLPYYPAASSLGIDPSSLRVYVHTGLLTASQQHYS